MTSNDLILRPFASSDVDRALGIAADLGLSYWSRADYLAEIDHSDSHLTVAIASGEMAGFMVARRVPGPKNGGADAEIYNIGVDRRFQRSGIGSYLLRDFIDECEYWSVENIWLDVRSGNGTAILFYEKFGFEEFSIRSRFYRDPVEDGMIMRLLLPGNVR